MDNPDDLLFTRHVTAHIKGNVDKDKISVSSPEVMARMETIFEGYSYSPSTSLGELRGKIENFLHGNDPLNIVEQSNPGQLDEYLPEADMIIWLHLELPCWTMQRNMHPFHPIFPCMCQPAWLRVLICAFVRPKA